ncbi:MAG: 3-methylmercaptopropionyl-CoA dehydrogenase [Alphaproteobacteria bacterium MarineAlpha5_Bin12]|nr:MAG: 3-methylmercaptopropionyl-CoA dehydrogenase [Alphaproteobacteria bacterium MarineAlpha5_Bin12]|tara:strand:+ start:16947 stop:18722 length:1776 start_codon:yes stop_codon:yes gene_type:complete
MTAYKAPTEDMIFLFNELLDNENFKEIDEYKEVNTELAQSIILEAAKMTENSIFPLAKSGDDYGCKLENGEVKTPPKYKETYEKFIADGWTSLACDPKYGGQGLPKSLSIFFDEMMSSASLSFKLYSELSHGAYNCIYHHASEDLKNKFLPKLVEGKWSGTMCLTESHCGTDLGILKTKAVFQDKDSYKITGQKIFITSGDHDLTENIIHLVLARLPDSPEGTKGISLFLVPKFIVNEDGSIGNRNGVSTGSIEQKMGIKGSATCVLNFDDAIGYLIGEKNKGLNSMFTMMNLERIVVGIQGIGLSETAYQNALVYALDRKQGRKDRRQPTKDDLADPIIVHADVRKNILFMKSLIEGERALAFWLSQNADVMLKHNDPTVRENASDIVALMTPVIKSFFTDIGVEITNNAMEVYGGHGYIKEHGMEQLVRDVHIAPIYEGTNAVQAIDLVLRKLTMKDGKVINSYLAHIDKEINKLSSEDNLKGFCSLLNKYNSILKDLTSWIQNNVKTNQDEVNSAATEYLNIFALVSIGLMWLKMADVAYRKIEENKDFYKSKIDCASIFFTRILTRIDAYSNVKSGSDIIMNYNFKN